MEGSQTPFGLMVLFNITLWITEDLLSQSSQTPFGLMVLFNVSEEPHFPRVLLLGSQTPFGLMVLFNEWAKWCLMTGKVIVSNTFRFNGVV